MKNKSVNEAMTFFYHNLTKAYNKSFPIVKLSRKRANDKPWITSGLKTSIKKKHLLYKKYLQNRSDENRLEYTTYNNDLRTIIRKTEIKYYKRVFNEKENGIKQMWKTLSAILNRNKSSKPKSINKLNMNGKNIYNDKDIADALNNYFANIGKNLSHQINNNNSRSFRNCLKNPVSEYIFIKPTNYKEVEKEFDQFKTMKTGVFPDLLKVAKVIPIYKDDEADLPKNYRPISFLSIFDKLLEKVVHTRVKSFLDKHPVLYKYQFGFRSKSSTTYALLDVSDYIYTSLDQGKYVFGVYIDLKKAFDTVSHKILLTKLEHYGIRGLALNWFSSYLSNRSQFVFINNVSSSIISTCNYGVPQGSLLGPLLFLLFINDIHEAIKCSTIKLFADDTNCFFSGYDFETLRETVVTEVCSLQQWINANKLTINSDKKNLDLMYLNP